MLSTAKIFSIGNSQAALLPSAFRVDVSEMRIAKNEVTKEITLKPKDEDAGKARLELLCKVIRENPLPEDFLPEATHRNNPPCSPFADWADSKSKLKSGGQKPENHKVICYLVDTNIVGYFARRSYKPLLVRMEEALCSNELAISAITRAETLFGLARLDSDHKRRRTVELILEAFPSLEWKTEAADCYGEIATVLER